MDSVILGLRVLVALGAVLGLMWYLQRRVGKAKGHGRRRANRTLSVVSRQSVGQKASVVVIDAGDKRFLLGVTEHSINVLHAGDIPVESVEITATDGTAPAEGFAAGAEGFAAVFQEAAGMPRRADLHRRVAPANIAGSRLAGPGLPASRLHGSLLAGSTWRQAAEALRGRRS